LKIIVPTLDELRFPLVTLWVKWHRVEYKTRARRVGGLFDGHHAKVIVGFVGFVYILFSFYYYLFYIYYIIL